MNSSVTGKTRQIVTTVGAVLLLAAVTTPTWAASNESAQDGKSETAIAEPLTDISLVKVDAKYVCMPNNRLFKKEQLSTEIDGKTYYGCCQMCINALNSDPQQRIAIDPVSGKEIDKAKAVIGAAPDNSIFYFETEENLADFRLAPTTQE
ncbi:MAG: hypothetical protein V3S30_03440 [Thermoanaerobaculia bacterium]